MDNPIAKVPSKYLAFDGLLDDKGDGLPHLVGSIFHFLKKRQKIRLVIELESECICGTTFVFSTFVVGFEKFWKFHKKRVSKYPLQLPLGKGESFSFPLLDKEGRGEVGWGEEIKS